MTSIQAKITLKVMQLQAFSWAKGSIVAQRARQKKLAGIFKIPADVNVEKITVDGIPAELINVENPGKDIILYLHGGAYAVGSAYVHREYLSRLAKVCRCKVLAIDYRLAPEHPFPAALEDALRAYDSLIQGHDPANIVIVGDSAGGGLAIATLVSLRDAQKPLPACAVCISPWLNLSCTSSKANNNNDPILNPELLSVYSRYYAGHTDPTDPLISPLFAELKGLPPILIHAGTNEILLDQIKQFHENARQAGVDVAIELWDGLFHVFQIVPILPETKLSLEKIADFIASRINLDAVTETAI